MTNLQRRLIRDRYVALGVRVRNGRVLLLEPMRADKGIAHYIYGVEWRDVGSVEEVLADIEQWHPRKIPDGLIRGPGWN